MPANLTPQYKKAEENYRKAKTVEEKIAALEDMLALIPKHKGTDKLQADIKRRLSQCRQAQEKQSQKKGGRRDPFHVEKTGGGQVTFLGTPNTGKTALVNLLCNTEFKEGEYPFTTQAPAPAMTYYEDGAIQVVDLPPITADMVPPGMVGALRQSDLVAIVIGLGSQDILEQVEICENLLHQRGMIPFTKSVQEAKAMELEIGFPKPCLILANQCDLDLEGNLATFQELYEGNLEILPVSAKTGENLPLLKKRFFELLDFIRIYSKLPGKDPDMGEPFLLPKGSTIADLAYKIHRDLPKNMKFARVWGQSAKFPGQQLQGNHILADKDIVEIHD